MPHHHWLRHCYLSNGYVIAARCDQSLHGGGIITMVQESILFDEIDTLMVSLPKVSEVVTIGHREFLIVCCNCQPSTSDLTLFRLLDKLLNADLSLSPMIYGYFNVHGVSWLHSSHTSVTGVAALDFCESRGLHQLVSFPTRQSTTGQSTTFFLNIVARCLLQFKSRTTQLNRL